MPVALRHHPIVFTLALASLAACAKKAESAADIAAAPELAKSADAPAAAKEAEDTQLELATAPERKVIRTARIELRADDPAGVAATATKLTEGSGGFVASSNATGIGDAIERIDMRLRVPADKFEGVLESLRDDGELLVEGLQGQDVTDEYIDLEARLRSQKALEERLLSILATTSLVKDVLEVEAKLVDVRTEIERIEGHLRAMNDRVSFATIELAVVAPVRHNAREAESTWSRFDRAVDDAGEACVAVLTGLIRVFGAILPLGIVGIPIGLGVQAAIRRRRRARALAEKR
jgi:hypothetical protein